LLGRCQEVVGPRKKFRFKNKLLSLEASVIDLCASLYDWARFRRTKGGVKLHLVLDHDGYLPTFAVIEAAKVPEVKIARQLRFEAGAIVVCDRGYIDYQWFKSLTEEGVSRGCGRTWCMGSLRSARVRRTERCWPTGRVPEEQ